MDKKLVTILILFLTRRGRCEYQTSLRVADALKNGQLGTVNSALNDERRSCEKDGDCLEGGFCAEDKFCSLEPGPSGDIPRACKSTCSRKCLYDGGLRVYDESSSTIQCECGEKILSFPRQSCPASCDTDGDCHNGGVCAIDKFCVCGEGLEGDTCEIITDCETGHLKNCRNTGGECSYDTKSSTPYCDCGPVKKFDPHQDRCRGYCRSDIDCNNGGVCTERDFCECPAGFSGDSCDLVVNCTSGCESSGGKCIFDDEPAGAYCECGTHRKFDMNWKICVEVERPTDLSTPSTSTAFGICTPETCVHGTCEETDFIYKCRCYEGFTGVNCEKRVRDGYPESMNNSGIIVIVVLSAASTVFFVISVIMVFRYRRLKEKFNSTSC